MSYCDIWILATTVSEKSQFFCQFWSLRKEGERLWWGYAVRYPLTPPPTSNLTQKLDQISLDMQRSIKLWKETVVASVVCWGGGGPNCRPNCVRLCVTVSFFFFYYHHLLFLLVSSCLFCCNVELPHPGIDRGSYLMWNILSFHDQRSEFFC